MPGTRMQRKYERGGLTYLPFTSLLSRELDEMQASFRRAFGETSGAELGTSMAGFYPTTEIAETSEEFTLTAEVPGMKQEQIQVDFDGGVLTIQGEKQEERRDGDGERDYHLYERTYGSFQRSFTFPGSVDEQKITAEFRDGLLTVHLPKVVEEKQRGRRISIGESK